MVKRVAGLVLGAAFAGCSLTQPLSGSYSCGPAGACLDDFVCNAQNRCVAPSATTGPAASTGSGSSGGTSGGAASGSSTASGSTTGGSTRGGGTASSGSSGTTAGSSTGQGSSSGGGLGNFAGEWDTSFAHVSLAQSGTVVTGRYHDWGYTYSDATHAGTISGLANGDGFIGTFQDNVPFAPVTPLNWTLSSRQLNGNYQPVGDPPYPWCGVAAGLGTPLPNGCGWSDYFASPYNPENGGGPVTLQQVADEVTGVWYTNLNGAPGAVAGIFEGVVSDSRVNGQYLSLVGGQPGRFSFWMTRDATQFAGNYFFRSGFNQWCGGRGATVPPVPCLGGGGIYDGTWFTNLGTLTLLQAEPSTTPVTGVWFGWGDDAEYEIGNGVVAGPVDGGASTDYALSWTDSSPVGGASGLTSLSTDPNGITLQGDVVLDGGGLWCGVNYGANPYVPFQVDAGQIGALFPGCGLTNGWTLSGGPGAPPLVAEVVQVRGTVAGSWDGGQLAGVVAFDDAGVGAWTVVRGTWGNLPDAGGTFNWYPDSLDQTFSGDFESIGADAGAWCGSTNGTEPTPCLQ